MKFSLPILKNELTKRFQMAREILTDEKQLEALLIAVEEKIKTVPLIGEELAKIIVLVEILKDYIQKKYTAIPITSLVAIVAALLYFLTPIDLVLDSIPLLGFLDDFSILRLAFEMVGEDVRNYKEWKKMQEDKETLED